MYGAHLEFQQHHGLAQFVMQLPGDPAALNFLDIEELRRQIPQPLLRFYEFDLILLANRDIPDDGKNGGPTGELKVVGMDFHRYLFAIFVLDNGLKKERSVVGTLLP